MTAALASLYAADYRSTEGSGVMIRTATDTRNLRRTFAYCLAGTMGLLTPQVVQSRYATSVAPMHYEPATRNGQAATAIELERTAAEDVARIRNVLKPTVLELSNLFGVSRQAVYDWQAGAQPSPEAAKRLSRLARAADEFDKTGLLVDSQTLRRKVSGGRTLLDAVLSDDDAVGVAQELVSTLRREAGQRQRLQQQLGGRKRGAAGPGDFGAPALSNEV